MRKNYYAAFRASVKKYVHEVENLRIVRAFWYATATVNDEARLKYIETKVEAAKLCGYETIVTADAEGLHFHFRKNLPNRYNYAFCSSL